MRKYSIAPIAPIAAAVLLAFAGSADAATKTDTFKVNANVQANCIVSATNLNFGNYRGIADLNGTSDVVVRCTNGSDYTLTLSEGSSLDFATRLMSDTVSGGTLQYNLYTDTGHTDIWGNGTDSSTVTGTGAGMASGSAVTHTVYGLLPDNATNQAAPAGSYSDTITVTVEY
jgi:spore coat protein U-like protein